MLNRRKNICFYESTMAMVSFSLLQLMTLVFKSKVDRNTLIVDNLYVRNLGTVTTQTRVVKPNCSYASIQLHWILVSL